MHRPFRTFALVVIVAGLVGCSSSSGGSSGTSPSTVAPSPELVARTRAAHVPLLSAEGVATHIHTQLDVTVNGKSFEVPAGIGIDEASGHIAALHTHDTTGLMHVESAKANDSYTLDQFLTVWGMPTDAAGRCEFFQAASPCTLSVTSKKSGPVGLDVVLVDHDTLTLRVTSG